LTVLLCRKHEKIGLIQVCFQNENHRRKENGKKSLHPGSMCPFSHLSALERGFGTSKESKQIFRKFGPSVHDTSKCWCCEFNAGVKKIKGLVGFGHNFSPLNSVARILCFQGSFFQH